MAQKDTRPFGLDTIMDVDAEPNLENVSLLGQEYQDVEGKVYRIVRLNVSGGFVAAKKVFKYTDHTLTTDARWDVEPVDAQTDRPAGVGAPELDAALVVADNAYFYVQVAGETTVIKGDDAANVTVGDFIDPDNDADTGKVFTNTTTHTEKVTLGTALDATTGTDEDVRVILHGKLTG